MSDEEPPEVVQAADSLYESLRTINHVTLPGSSLPAPIVYRVLGNLKGIEYLLPQGLSQLAAGLGKSLDTYDVYEDDGRDPVQSIATVTDHLTRASQLAQQLGAELGRAQSAISRQGYRQQ